MAPTSFPSLKLQTFTIRREGAVEWKVTGDSHCGPRTEVREGVDGSMLMPVRYAVRVTCAPSLDDRGFLFDQAAVDLFMRRLASRVTPLSCEELATEVAEALLAKIARDVPTCRVVALSLTLSPAPHAASITVDYE